MATFLGIGAIPYLLLYLGGVAVCLWALVDAVARPSAAFTLAGSNKALWIALIAICTFVVPIIGVVLAIFYLASIRPRVRSGQSF